MVNGQQCGYNLFSAPWGLLFGLASVLAATHPTGFAQCFVRISFDCASGECESKAQTQANVTSWVASRDVLFDEKSVGKPEDRPWDALELLMGTLHFHGAYQPDSALETKAFAGVRLLATVPSVLLLVAVTVLERAIRDHLLLVGAHGSDVFCPAYVKTVTYYDPCLHRYRAQSLGSVGMAIAISLGSTYETSGLVPDSEGVCNDEDSRFPTKRVRRQKCWQESARQLDFY